MKLKANKNKIYYLASPFSHASPLVKEIRKIITNYVATQLTLEGYTLIEPIETCHEKEKLYGLPGEYAFWKRRDRSFVERSDGVFVVTLKGWRESIGVSDEIKYARKLKKPVYFLDLSKYLTDEILNQVSYEKATNFL